MTAAEYQAYRMAEEKKARKEQKKLYRQQQKLGRNGFNNGGLCGLYNLGNTCFISSALQCLSFSLPLTEYFHRNLFIREINDTNPLGSKGQLALAYGKIIKQMWRMRPMQAVEPRQFKRSVLQMPENECIRAVSYLFELVRVTDIAFI